jgi:ribulose 1,5-bisphosphate synthetase/thiazole synthase
MSERATPETDAAEWGITPHDMVVRSGLARKLERELAQAREQRDKLAEAVRELCETLLVKEPRDITDLLNKAGKALAAVKGGCHE